MKTPPLARSTLFSSMMRREENLAYAKAQAARGGPSRIDESTYPGSPDSPNSLRVRSGGENPGVNRAVRSRSCSPDEGYSDSGPHSECPERGKAKRRERYVVSETLKKVDEAVRTHAEAAFLRQKMVPPEDPGSCHHTMLLSDQMLAKTWSEDIIEDFHQLEPVEIFMLDYENGCSSAYTCIKACYDNDKHKALITLNLWLSRGIDKTDMPLPEGFTEVYPLSEEMLGGITLYVTGISLRHYDRNLARAVLTNPASQPDSRPFRRYITLAMLKGAMRDICTSQQSDSVDAVFTDFCINAQLGAGADQKEAFSTWQSYIALIDTGKLDQACVLLPVLRGFFSVLDADVDEKITRESMNSLDNAFSQLMQERQPSLVGESVSEAMES